jgi:predicted HTH transcriptional regulator
MARKKVSRRKAVGTDGPSGTGPGAGSADVASPAPSESSTLEYKRELPAREDLLAVLCALANTAGGEVHIGVADDGRPVGMEEASILSSEEKVADWIAHGIKPQLLPLIRIRQTAQGPVLVVQVGLGSNRPYSRLGKDGEKVFVRIGSTTRMADAATVLRLKLQATGRSWDSLPVPGTRPATLDSTLVRAYWEARREARGIPLPKGGERDWLVKHRYLSNESGSLHPTHAGILMFHPQPQEILPQARVELARFARTDVRDFLDKQSLAGPLWKLPDQALDFLRRHVPVRARRGGLGSMRRAESLAYPEAAFREFFLNALCHRAYEDAGGVLHVALFDDMLEITNPGSLPEGLDLADLGTGISMLRNPLLARALNEIGLIEGWGTGIQTAQKELQAASLPQARFHLKGFFFQVASVWRWKADLTDEEQGILTQAAAAGSLSSAEVAVKLGLSERSARRILGVLVEKGLLIKTGSTRGAAYKLG